MILYPKVQPSLFNIPKAEAIEKSGVKELIISQWYDLEYLSFDIMKVNELTESQFIELIFISKLMSNVESKMMLNYLLSKIQKPYAYKHNEVFFNVFSDQWEYKDKSVDDYSDEELLNILIKNCDDKKEKLECLITEIEYKINDL